MNDQTLAMRVREIAGTWITVVGDAILDRYVYGEVGRISPEAPVPVLHIDREQDMLGGAGNVVRNVAALGARSAFIGILGGDRTAVRIAELLDQIELVEPMTVMVPGRKTPHKTRYISGQQQLLRVDDETVTPAPESETQILIEAALRKVAQSQAMIISDYGKGTLTQATLERLIGAFRSAGKWVLVDPKGRDYARYCGASLITPNRKELSEASGMPVGDDAQIERAARKIIDTCGVDAVLVTRSQDGMTLVTAASESPGISGDMRGAVRHLPARAREVFDVSGAGDTVIATVAAGLAAGLDLIDAALLANAAGGIVVGKAGTATVSADELEGALLHREIEAGELKVLSIEALLEKVSAWREKGQKIGFTNGCFDLLHPGHISLLEQARRRCDRLIVAANSDDSVRRLKGPERPVQNEAARTAVLGSLAAVDAVVLFAADTPYELIGQIRPDVLVKGADYSLDGVVGADIVKSYGGEVFLAELADGHSTTATISRMAKSKNRSSKPSASGRSGKAASGLKKPLDKAAEQRKSGKAGKSRSRKAGKAKSGPS